MASLDVIALDPTVPQLRAPAVGDTYHFCRVVEFQDGTDAAPSITNVGDTNTGIYWPNADELAVSTGGVQRMSLGATTVFNETGADVDFRIEGDTDANLVFVDASTDRVGLGLNNPDRLLDVDGSSKFRGQILITSGEALGLGLQALQLPTGVESTIGAGLSTRTGVAGESIIQFGNNMNTYYTGSVNAAKAGAMIRIDTRGVEPTPGASAYSVFQIQTRAAGVADPNYTVPVQIGAAPQGTFCIQTNGLATFNYGFVVNEGGGDYDTRFEGDTDTHLFFADASTDRIGIGTASPAVKLQVAGAIRSNSSVTGPLANLHTSATNPASTGASGNGLNFGYDSNGEVAWIQANRNDITETRNLLLNPNGGNLGLGVTPSAWSGGAAIDLPTNSAVCGNSSVGFAATFNAYYNSGWKYKANTAARAYVMDSANHIWYNAASGTAGNTISFTQAMTLDASGNLGIGTTSPGQRLQVTSAGAVTRALIENTDNAAFGAGIQMLVKSGASTVGAGTIRIDNSGNLAFATGTSSDTIRATITSGGDLLVGRTSGGLSNTSGVTLWQSNIGLQSEGDAVQIYLNRTASDGTIQEFRRNNATVGTISVTTTATAYNTSSDRRLKENIVAADDAGSVIDAIEIVKHDWKVGGHVRYGVIAQDLNKVAPEAVKVGDDNGEVTDAWAVDYSKLVPMLIKEVQSLRKRVAELEAK